MREAQEKLSSGSGKSKPRTETVSQALVKTTNQKIKIVVVDDHPTLRQGIVKLVGQENDMLFAGEAGDADEAMTVIAKVNPDIVIVDISLKGSSGLELTRKIIANFPNVLVLIMSMYDEALYVERALRAGARGYLMKQEAADHVALAIRKILNGEVYVSQKWQESLINQFIDGAPVGVSSLTDRLTDREREVLYIIGQGCSTRQIAEALHLSVKTIESHNANIKQKFNLKNSNELIQFAVRLRYSDK